MTDTPAEQSPLPEGTAQEELRKLAPVLSLVNAGTAAAIMADPAGAAAAASPVTPQEYGQRALDALPGLVGAIDHAIRDQTGKAQPFALIVFAEGAAFHSANFDPAEAKRVLIELATRWDSGVDEAQLVQPGETLPEDATPGQDATPHATH